MPVSPARLTAFEILLKIERQTAYSSELLHSEARDDLSAADRALAMELVMGVLRWRSRLDATIERFSFTPFRKLDLEVLTALRLGVYQLEFLMRVPARAAINESVELVKHSRKASAAPMTNAVLRKVPKCGNEEREARHQASFAATSDDGHELTERLGEAFAHPRWLVERWVKHYGAVAAEAICRYGQTVPATTLRRPGTDDKLHWWEVGVGVLPGELLHSARRVSSGHLNPAAGLAVQDEGSQLVAALVGHGRRILDCCAAPGGKTGAMAERNPEAEMVAVDVHPHRVRLMKRLLGESRVQLLVADARALPLDGGFDRVLVDVPCSGTGTLARNPEIKWRLTVADLADLAERQRAILQGGLAQLAAGGRLVYATCSLEPEENEMVVEAVLRETEGVAVLDVRQELGRLRDEGELAWAEVESLTRGPYLRTLPGVHPCDGFFAAVLELRPK